MTDSTAARASRLLDLFCDADRLRIAGLLVDRPLTITKLASELDLKPQVAAMHVRTLDDAGLIQRPDDGASTLIFDMSTFQREAAELRPDEPEAFEGESANDARILRSFITDGRLTSLPTQRSRWLVVLQWLAEKFEQDRQYPEPEVNEMLGKVHEDHALLRRQLVDEGFMDRDHGVYWRTEVGDIA